MKWIPVTERLPDDDREVLVTIKSGDETLVSIDCYYKSLVPNFTGWINAYTDDQIIAWAELPEPYGVEYE